LSEDHIVKPGIIFGVVLVIIIGAMIASHQLSERGNDHFDKAGENWKQN
jgi:heme O synthase-like polyprenyltransferase